MKKLEKNRLSVLHMFVGASFCASLGGSTSVLAAPSEDLSKVIYQPFFKITAQEEQDLSSGKKTHNATPKGYGPDQIKAAYGLDRISGQGEGQTIAIIDAYGNKTMASDLDTFSQKYSLPSTTSGQFQFKSISPQGIGTTNAKNASGWMVETCLDVEWAHAIAPKANILLVQAKSASNTDLMAALASALASDPKPSVVSMSFGGPESKTAKAETTQDSHFKVPGVVFVASSGDNGAGASYPAASPYVVAVGGTHLPLSTTGALTGQETAWTGSGGGESAVEAAPSFQTEAFAKAGIQSTARGIPDVSYDADPETGFAIYFSQAYQTAETGSKTGTVTGWFEVGGTSAGSPQWAAIFAIVNGMRSSPLSANQALYTLADSSQYKIFFRDITKGADGSAPSDQAHAYYDFVTGLGSPLADQLIPALVKAN